ncbi:putative NADPH-dependent methylglyoxal reductase-like protein [Hapsidospora chrysogenum ATCC 11550]|uniref:Putative NADPH-dependent methylglyoxal reductase-like protein n=1 Tax=Hapsidospora chrysogenum (strain ATCC 11550 / CBS 779.69 / DSM 880 / IAM 14645 / JCM 23072 / IMI 49137) TaxID=857340 RepID=A0A086TBM7_HAPC1|nr:putative NADPH-dependent methylglyoxal reductase-like protein [Hapsidospora chrysogenum ATCC 11550]
MTKVLLTGGSGFIAAHCLEQLLAQGHNVVTTVRSEDKAQKIRDTYKDQASRLEVVIVPDIAKEDAFDEVVKTPGLEVVLHTASPFHFNWTDPEKELINPAVVGTTGILRAIQHSAPSVRRVVVTSSFASILDESKLTDPNHTFTEASWNPSTRADIHRSKPTAYRVSKTLAEQSAWAFVRDQKPGFDLVTICPPLVLGPLAHHLPSLDAINESNARVVKLLRGEWKNEIPSQGPVSIWVDVRDLARAHILAMDKPEFGGKRLFTTAGYFSNAEIAAVVRDRFPEYNDRLPGPEVKGGELPEVDKTFKWDVSATDKLLGFEWISLDKSISDLVNSLKAFGI